MKNVHPCTFFILEFCFSKTLEVWNHRHPWRLGNVHPQSFFHLRVCINSAYGRIELRVLLTAKHRQDIDYCKLSPISLADKDIYKKKGSQYSELPFVLPPEVCKSFVCFGHSVNFFFLFEGCSGVVVGINQL